MVVLAHASAISQRQSRTRSSSLLLKTLTKAITTSSTLSSSAPSSATTLNKNVQSNVGQASCYYGNLLKSSSSPNLRSNEDHHSRVGIQFRHSHSHCHSGNTTVPADSGSLIRPATTGRRSNFSSLAQEMEYDFDDDLAMDMDMDAPVVVPQEVSSPERSTATVVSVPKWSYHKRVLPTNLTELSSPMGKRLFVESLLGGHAESYFPLAEQFVTQGDPAYCGLSTLAMVLNALSIDPNVRWKGGWRWFDEEMVVSGCCVDLDTVKQQGITLDQFKMMGRCNGAHVTMHRPSRVVHHNNNNNNNTATTSRQSRLEQERLDMDVFRSHVQQYVRLEVGDDDDSHNKSLLTTPPAPSQAAFLVASYARSALGQTGDGHFSPIAAYHQESDQVLILDVARFKYAPYWVPLASLYRAMTLKDETTGLSRGWCQVHAPRDYVPTSHRAIPTELLSTMMTRDRCPVGVIKVHFCKASSSSHHPPPPHHHHDSTKKAAVSSSRRR